MIMRMSAPPPPHAQWIHAPPFALTKARVFQIGENVSNMVNILLFAPCGWRQNEKTASESQKNSGMRVVIHEFWSQTTYITLWHKPL